MQLSIFNITNFLLIPLLFVEAFYIDYIAAGLMILFLLFIIYSTITIHGAKQAYKDSTRVDGLSSLIKLGIQVGSIIALTYVGFPMVAIFYAFTMIYLLV